jgi:hypothetical protein
VPSPGIAAVLQTGIGARGSAPCRSISPHRRRTRSRILGMLSMYIDTEPVGLLHLVHRQTDWGAVCRYGLCLSWPAVPSADAAALDAHLIGRCE